MDYTDPPNHAMRCKRCSGIAWNVALGPNMKLLGFVCHTCGFSSLAGAVL